MEFTIQVSGIAGILTPLKLVMSMNSKTANATPKAPGFTPGSCAGSVSYVCVSAGTGTAKLQVAEVLLIAEKGFQGDGHAGTIRQVSLLQREHVDAFNAGHSLNAQPGDFAENIQTRGIDLGAIRVGDLLRLGTALLEVTQIGKATKPHHYAFHGHRLLPARGAFCRVLENGLVQVGTPLWVESKVRR